MRRHEPTDALIPHCRSRVDRSRAGTESKGTALPWTAGVADSYDMYATSDVLVGYA